MEREKADANAKTELNTAYYIVGTTDELSKRGLIEKKAQC